MKKLLVCLAALLLGLGIVAGNGAQAKAASNKKAKKAFYEWMSQDKIPWGQNEYSVFLRDSCSFRYMEIGKKKTPILIVSSSETCHADGYVEVLQYVNGKVKCMIVNDWIEKIYPKSGMIVACHSGGNCGEIDSYYYKMNSKGVFGDSVAYTGILDARSTTDEEYKNYLNMREMFGEDKYKIANKSVSKSKFNKWLKKNTNGEKGKGYGKLYKNTAKNRKKYLK